MECTKGELAVLHENPPEDLYAECVRQKMIGNVIAHKCVSKAEAEERCGLDARLTNNGRVAMCYCSGCGGRFIANHESEGNIRYTADGSVIEARDGTKTECPMCGEQGMVKSRENTRVAGIWVPKVRDGRLWMIKWRVIEGVSAERGTVIDKDALEAVRIDSKSCKRYTAYANYMGRYRRKQEWTSTQKFQDTVCTPYVYKGKGWPSLDGTELENCRLWDYADQCYDIDRFAPVMWLRIWQRHKNAEALMDAGFGMQIYKKERDRIEGYGRDVFAAPKADYANWKKKKPHEMLGIEKQELETVRKWEDAFELLRVRGSCRVKEIDEMIQMGLGTETIKLCCKQPKPLKAARYLKNGGWSYVTYADYLEACRNVEGEITEQLRYPKDLRRAHDEMTARKKMLKDKILNAKMEKMAEAMEGLAYNDGYICIRAARNEAELIMEGSVLHHCVGGYGKQHTEGRVILFVRHARRPERSWYTLNIDLTRGRKEIQLHGYGNEYAHGKRLTVRPEVRKFVDNWEKTVLKKWVMPQQLKKMIEA